jgi:hypothetical protein
MSSSTPGHAGPIDRDARDEGPDRAGTGLVVSAPFAGLVAELGELGFEASLRPVDPGRVVYTATDSPVTVTLVADPSPYVRAYHPANGRSWYVTWGADTPLHVQLIALYAVLNDDPTTALGAAAASLGAAPPDEPERPSPAG